MIMKSGFHSQNGRAFLIVTALLVLCLVLVGQAFARGEREAATVLLDNLAHSQFAGTNYDGLLAGGVILTLPAVVFFLFLQHHLIAGMTARATKG